MFKMTMLSEIKGYNEAYFIYIPSHSSQKVIGNVISFWFNSNLHGRSGRDHLYLLHVPKVERLLVFAHMFSDM